MGYFVRNPYINHHNSVMPVGPTVDRESAPKPGSFRFNTDAAKFEVFNGTAWVYMSVTGVTTIAKDTFVGDAVQVDFTMSRQIASAYDVMVFIGNTYQEPEVAYTVSGTTISFTSPPPLKNTIVVLRGLSGAS